MAATRMSMFHTLRQGLSVSKAEEMLTSICDRDSSDIPDSEIEEDNDAHDCHSEEYTDVLSDSDSKEPTAQTSQ